MIGLFVNIEKLWWSSYLMNLKWKPVTDFSLTKIEGQKTLSFKYCIFLEQTRN